MMSVGSEARFTANCKIFALGAATITLLAMTTAGPAAADPPAANSGSTAQVAQIYPNPAYAPRAYNAPMSPLDMLAAAFGIYNAPTEPGGGWYAGPMGSASFLRDSDIIKRFESRTIDTLTTPGSTTGNSSWRLGSGPGGAWSIHGGILPGAVTPVNASDPWRLSTEGGSKVKQLTSSTGYDVGGRVGYQFSGVRIEGLFDYANNSVDTFGRADRTFSTDFVMRDRFEMRERSASGSTTSKVFLINGFIDVNVPFLTPYGATPYFGGGIGAGETSLDLKWGNRTIVNSSDWGVAYDLGAGVRWSLAPSWSLDLGYRYKGITDVTLRTNFGSVTVPNRSHTLEASLVWKLPWGSAAYPPSVVPAAPYTPVTPANPYIWQQGPQFGPPPSSWPYWNSVPPPPPPPPPP